ncbi:DUF1871 family protein [Bacillaceae bacterium Marseille-Q3522]|nr:DUF1871 family protein [Bacillaceae bacterium Marseille-Q3522]
MRDITTDIVTRYINRWDPMQLLAGGAPDDEYDTEVEQIVEAVLESKDEIEIAEAIQDTFKFTFQRDFSFVECLSIARFIWKNLYE